MKHRARPTSAPALDAQRIDELYGLDPVFEPGENAAGEDAENAPFVVVNCPYCGEPFETRLDISAGSASYIEDCQVCCRPIEMRLQVGDDGRRYRFEAGRSD